jgi:EAL domain-containing protein (putative c-di-GMP-specific phosphodiesterase class I)
LVTDAEGRPAPRAVTSPASPDKLQLLGVAFASADLAFEVDGDGRITFAIGAGSQILGVEAHVLVGQDWRTFVDAGDAGAIGLILADLADGERRGSIRLRCVSLAAGHATTEGELSVFRLPGRQARISCAFRRNESAALSGRPKTAGLLDRNAFEDLTAAVLDEAAAAGAPLHLDLVELPGFEASTRALPAAAGAQARRDVVDALRASAYGGFAAAELAPDRFAVMSSVDGAQMLARLGRITGGPVTAASAPLGQGLEPAHSLRAIRFALDRHIEAGPAAAGDGFHAVLEATMRRADAFKQALNGGDFSLVFQPVVDLRTRRLHHFEALARFDEGSSPQDIIQLAEELNLITEFDLAVFRRVVEALTSAQAVQIAVNLSARSLVAPGLVEALTALAGADLELRRRLLVEITETHALQDLEAANLLVGRLQSEGFTVCLDDFGAGAASIDYLRRLRVDIVKIDGRYIRALTSDPRDRIVVQHVISLCRDLGMAVIAEMVEDEETARIVAKLGAALGQGWLFGKPAPTLDWPAAAIPA